MTLTTMILVACVVQVLTVLVAYQYLSHRVDGKCQIKSLWRPKLDWTYLAVMAVTLVVSFGVFLKGLLLDRDVFMRALMNAEVLIALAVMGYIDLREKIIPNEIILSGLVFWLVMILLDIFVAKSAWKSTLRYSLVGGALVGGVMFVIALFAKSALGMGDVKMFFLLGLLYGAEDSYAILLFSVIIMAIVSLILLAMKKVTVKTAIPMAPFVVLGFILCILAGM